MSGKPIGDAERSRILLFPASQETAEQGSTEFPTLKVLPLASVASRRHLDERSGSVSLLRG